VLAHFAKVRELTPVAGAEATNAMGDRNVRILTCVTNGQGIGPGHTALAVENTVYSFENMADIFSIITESSGWKTFNYPGYLKQNSFRPVLIQKLSIKCNPDYLLQYIDKSTKRDDDYGSSGVCSTLASKAINYALPEEIIFDPKGIDTPFGVYHCARRLGLVLAEQYLWPDCKTVNHLAWASIANTLKSDYPAAYKAMDLTR
jgi:hypothetical protein